MLSRFSRVQLCATPETAAHQAPPSLGFSRQEHWSGLPSPSPMHESEKWKWSRSVVSDSLRPHGLQPTMLLHPWDFPGKSTGEACHCLLRWNGQRDGKVWPRKESSVHKLCPFLVGSEGDIGCLLALAGWYKPPTGFSHKPYEITVEPQSRAPYLLHAGHVIHSHKHTVQSVKNLPAMRETWVWSLGWEDPLEEGMATHTSILAWRIPMDWADCGPWGHKESDTTERLSISQYV